MSEIKPFLMFTNMIKTLEAHLSFYGFEQSTIEGVIHYKIDNRWLTAKELTLVSRHLGKIIKLLKDSPYTVATPDGKGGHIYSD